MDTKTIFLRGENPTVYGEGDVTSAEMAHATPMVQLLHNDIRALRSAGFPKYSTDQGFGRTDSAVSLIDHVPRSS